MTTRSRTLAVTIGVGLALGFAATLGFAEKTPAPQTTPAAQTPPVRQIPGLTAKDAYPNGCVDCHVNGKDGDKRLSTLLAELAKAVPAPLVEKARAASADPSKIKGKHPPIPNAKTNTPLSCLSGCHKRGSTIGPPFTQLMHAIHLVGGAQNHFLTVFQGECTYCHKLDQKTGQWKVGTAPEK